MLQNSNNFVSVTNETTLKMILSSKCELSFILAIFKCGRWTNWFWLTAVWREGWYFLPINGTHHNIDPIQSFSKWKPQDDFHLLLRLVSETLFYIHFCFFFSPDPLTILITYKAKKHSMLKKNTRQLFEIHCTPKADGKKILLVHKKEKCIWYD